jgi:hypothetical protein
MHMFMFLFSLPSQQLQKWQPHSSISLVIPLSAGSLYSFFFLFYFYFKKILIYFLKQRILLHWGGFPSSYSQKMLFYFPHIHVKKCTIRVVLIHQSYFLIQSYLYPPIFCFIFEKAVKLIEYCGTIG